MPAVEGRDYLTYPVKRNAAQDLSGLLGNIFQMIQMKNSMDQQNQKLQMERELHKHSIKKLDAEEKLAGLKNQLEAFNFQETQPGVIGPGDEKAGGELDLAGMDQGDMIPKFGDLGKPDIASTTGLSGAGVGYRTLAPSAVSEQRRPPMSFKGYEGIGVPDFTATPRTLSEVLADNIKKKMQEQEAAKIPLTGKLATESGMGDVDPRLVPVLDNLIKKDPSEVDLGPDAARMAGVKPGKYSRSDTDVFKAHMGETAAASRAALAGGRAAGNQEFTRTDKLRDDYNKEVKPFSGLNQRLSRMQASAKQGTGEGDLALMYDYIKMLDDMTGVREGEVKLTESAGSLKDRAEVALEKLKSGMSKGIIFSPEQRDRYLASAKAIAAAMGEAKGEIDDRYRAQADQFNINFDNLIVGTPGGGKPARPGAGKGGKTAGHTSIGTPQQKAVGPDGKIHLLELHDGMWTDMGLAQ